MAQNSENCSPSSFGGIKDYLGFSVCQCCVIHVIFVSLGVVFVSVLCHLCQFCVSVLSFVS